jgi:acetyl esterase
VQEIPYRTVGGRTLLLHVSPPREQTGSPVPTAVFFHGGGWTKGSWTQFLPQAARLNAMGVLAVLVEYRTEGPVVASSDAVAAMNAVFEKSPDFGCDPARVVAIGGSAGGHLALATAVLELPDTNPGHRPAALVLLNPVTNTTGDFPVGFGRRHFADDDHALRYSPVHHLSERTPPALVMHGTADTAVHHQNSVEFVEKMKRCGGQADIVLYPGQRHGFFNGDGTYFDRTTREMARFIRHTVGHGRRGGSADRALVDDAGQPNAVIPANGGAAGTPATRG